jgi:hypothetical protein
MALWLFGVPASFCGAPPRPPGETEKKKKKKEQGGSKTKSKDK